MKDKKEKIILSGMRPTGVLHIGNYFCALLPLVKLQDTAEKFFIMIADLHALTTLDDSKDLRKNSLALAMAFLASGIDPKRANIFVQSQIPEHAELANILGMITPLSILELNPVYKEMRLEQKENNLGLLAYPVLQAADILLYKTTGVPVGKDQEPHIEIAREIARKFNARFGNILIEPRVILQKESKIFSLQDPIKKMSKSHGEKTYISLLDSPEKINEKVKISITDSGKEIIYNPEKKPAISNLLTIYSLFSKKSIKEIEKKYRERGYAEFKKDLAKVILEGLAPIQKKYKELEKNPMAVEKIIKEGTMNARKTAKETMNLVHQKIGFLS
ncbi:MAG: tryptophan--tRNA ligase [Patescibacteria group bacterium]